jgi:hypothetical protein
LRNELSVDRFCRDRSVKPIRSRSETTRHIKRHRFAHSPLAADHAPSRCFGAVFRYRLEPSRPGRSKWSFPLLGSAALLGFHQRPSQVCSRNRWPIISDRPGPRACSSNRAPRFIFVGLIRRRCGNMRAISLAANQREIGLASGLRLPSAVRISKRRRARSRMTP